MKTMVRAMIEINGSSTVAYAINKTDQIITTENRMLMAKANISEWNAACDEFQAMQEEKKKAWIDNVFSTYPKNNDLPDCDGYNLIH